MSAFATCSTTRSTRPARSDVAGAGAAAETIGANQSQGAIQSTGDPLDLAIEGPGYFTVKQADGTPR